MTSYEIYLAILIIIFVALLGFTLWIDMKDHENLNRMHNDETDI